MDRAHSLQVLLHAWETCFGRPAEPEEREAAEALTWAVDLPSMFRRQDLILPLGLLWRRGDQPRHRLKVCIRWLEVGDPFLVIDYDLFDRETCEVEGWGPQWHLSPSTGEVALDQDTVPIPLPRFAGYTKALSLTLGAWCLAQVVLDESCLDEEVEDG